MSSKLEGHGVGRDKPAEIERLVKVLRAWIPDGDGYNSQYARDMAAAAHLLEQLAVQRKHHRARHKSYKRRLRELEATIEDAPGCTPQWLGGVLVFSDADESALRLQGQRVRLIPEATP